MRLRGCLPIVLALSVWSVPEGQTGAPPTLRYERPGGYSKGSGDTAAWIANSLDGVIHVYAFRPFQGDFAGVFHRTLFRDWIQDPYREDTRQNEPSFRALTVKGADSAMAASFKSVNGGARREHLRVAVLAAGRVALVDISANSPEAFERNRHVFATLLNSLHVTGGHPR
jgi:hypothetical protein